MTPKFKLLAAAALAAYAIFAGLWAARMLRSPEIDLSPPPEIVATATAPADAPVRLLIPALLLDAPIRHVDTDKQGNMAVPNSVTDVGWYRFGPAPGATGSPVIAGHVSGGPGKWAVFNRLKELSPGDEINIITETGSRLAFTVSESVSYPYQEVPLEKLFGRTDGRRLNLITCEGKRTPDGSTLDHRRVIFAVMK